MFFRPCLSILCLFHLFNSTALAASAVLGLDLGTEYIKATIVKPGIPLDIVLTKDSRRKELSAVAFKPAKIIKAGEFPERAYGSDAIALASRFPGDVYPNLKSLLVHGTDNSIVKEYALRHPALNLVSENIRSTTAFQSRAFVAEELPWTVEELLAMQLQAIQKNTLALAGKGSIIKDVVITVPPYFTVEEKRALLLAADLAGLRTLELISDGVAVGINYATTRTFPSINEGGKPETNLVFDMGAGSTKATILKFLGRTVKDVGKFNKTIQEVRALGSGWDRTLGGDTFNAVIVDDIVAQFIASPAAKKISLTAEAVMSQGRVAAKLWNEAEKLRQVLSANANTQAFFEGIYQDLDFRYKITRAEFEGMTKSHAARIVVVMQESLNAAGLRIKDIDSVILHGGASRTPLVQKELEKFIGDATKIKANVNSDESAVFGAGFRGAALSPSFRVKEIRVSDIASYTIGVKWTDVDGKLQHQSLWESSSFLGTKKHFTFRNQKDPFTMTLYQLIPSPENASPGTIEKEILAITTRNLTESISLLKEKHSCKADEMTAKLSIQNKADSGEVEVTKFIVECEVEEASEDKESMVDSVKGLFGFGKKDQAPLSDKDISDSTSSEPASSQSTSASSITTSGSTSSTSVPPVASKEAEKSKAGAKKRFQVVPLDYITEVKGLPQLPNSEINRMKERLAAFAHSDKLRRLRDEALNQLEGFSYKARDLIEDMEFVAVSTEKERTDLEAKSKETSEWIYSGGSEASREELRRRLKEMEAITTIIEIRKTEMANRPEKIATLQKALDDIKKLIVSITEEISSVAKEHAEFSASVSEQETSSATPSPTASDSASLGDEGKPTETESAPVEKPTLDPPVYTDADIVKLQNLHDDFLSWLTDKIAEQDKLSATDDPVLLCKDLDEKTKALQEVRMELIMKNMRKTLKSQRFSQKLKSNKPQVTRIKDDQNSKDKPSKTVKNPQATFTVGAGGKMPSEEEILELLRKQDETVVEQTPVSSESVKSEAGEKHVEL